MSSARAGVALATSRAEAARSTASSAVAHSHQQRELRDRMLKRARRASGLPPHRSLQTPTGKSRAPHAPPVLELPALHESSEEGSGGAQNPLPSPSGPDLVSGTAGDGAGGQGGAGGFSCSNRLQPPSPQLKVRRWVRDRVVSHPAFDALVLVCIVANTVTLAVSNPLETDRTRLEIISVLDTVFTAVFVLEMLLKMTAHVSGVCGTRTATSAPLP